MSRQPLSTLPLSQFIPINSTSPSKPTPLRQSASSLMTLNSLLPSPFLASTTPRAPAGPLSTIYDRTTTSRGAGGGGGGSPSRSRQSTSTSTPSRLIEQEEHQEGLPTDEITTATPPRRLLDLFVESASKESKSPRQRVQSIQQEDPAPAWSFFFDEESSEPAPRSSLPPSPVPRPTEEEFEGDTSPSAPFKENERLRPSSRQHFRSTSLLSLSRTESATESVLDQPTSLSLPASINPSPTRPPIATEPPRTPPSTTTTLNVEDGLLPSPTYPTSYPPLNPNLEQEATANPFSEGMFESFESESSNRRRSEGLADSEMGLLDGLGIGVGTVEDQVGRGRKRLSEGMREGEEKRTKPNE